MILLIKLYSLWLCQGVVLQLAVTVLEEKFVSPLDEVIRKRWIKLLNSWETVRMILFLILYSTTIPLLILCVLRHHTKDLTLTVVLSEV